MLYSRPLLETDLPKILTLELAKQAKLELLASSNVKPNISILHSALVSDWTEVIMDDYEELVGIYGIGKSYGIGVPWFIQGEKLKTKNLIIALHSRDVLSKMLDVAPILMNFVDARNRVTIKWLKWLGFIIEDSSNFYLHDKTVPFKLFYMER